MYVCIQYSNRMKSPCLIGSGRLFFDRVVIGKQSTHTHHARQQQQQGLCKSLHSSSMRYFAPAAAPQLFSDFANSIQRPFKTAAATIIAKRGSSQASKACTIVPNQHHHSLTKKSLKEGPQPNVQVPFLLIQYYRGMHHLHNCQCLY